MFGKWFLRTDRIKNICHPEPSEGTYQRLFASGEDDKIYIGR